LSSWIQIEAFRSITNVASELRIISKRLGKAVFKLIWLDSKYERILGEESGKNETVISSGLFLYILIQHLPK